MTHYVFDLSTGETYEESTVSRLFKTIGVVGDFRVINMEDLFNRIDKVAPYTAFELIRQAIIQKTGRSPSLKDIAKKIGVAEITVKKWSSGESAPSSDSLKKLVEAYELR